jgi:hypothetical protein
MTIGCFPQVLPQHESDDSSENTIPEKEDLEKMYDQHDCAEFESP